MDILFIIFYCERNAINQEDVMAKDTINDERWRF
jgi:hypothetical protein